MGVPYSPNVDYRKQARLAARRYGLDPHIFERQIGVESIGYSPSVISGSTASPAGAQGIAQFMPATARSLGVDPLRPVKALNAAAKLMAGYVRKYGSYDAALRAYNAGPGAIQASHGFAETNNYVSKILHGNDPRKLGQPGPPHVAGRPGGHPQGGGGVTSLSQLVSSPGTVIDPVQASQLQQLLTPQRPAVPITAPQPLAQGADRYLRGASAGIIPSSGAPQPQGGSLADQLAALGGAPPLVVPGSSQRVTVTGHGRPVNGPVGRTLVIGDSLEVGTFPLLKKMLGGKVQGVFVGGKPSSWGIQQLRQQFRAGKFQNVVFDMGTNDASVGELRQSLRQLTQIAGGAKVYVSTVNSPWDEGAKNRLLHTYARNHPNVEVIKWHGASQGGAILPDGIHGAYGKRANLIAGALGFDPRASQPAPAGNGKVKILPGADRAGASTRPVVKNFVSEVSAFLGRPVTISTGTNHTEYVSGRPGVVSDHWTGHGADLGSVSNGFAVGGSGGDRLAAAAIRAATGMSKAAALRLARAGGIHNFYPSSGRWAGRRIQIIWKAPDHYDHVHVGIQ